MRSIRHAHTKFHPRTGLPLQPVGRRKDGRLIWPIMGAAEGDGDAGGDAGGGDAGGDAGDKGDAGGDAGDAGDKAGDAGKQDKGSKQGDDSPWTDPEKARAEIERLRRENGADRTKAKEQAAEEARKAALEEVAKALGLKEGDKAPTAEELAAQLTEQTSKADQASAIARDTQAELVVWQNATSLGVDAQALTDSRAFAAAIKNLDPADDKFAEDVKKAAQEAVEKNPKLKAGQVSGSSSADHGGSGGGTKETKSLPLDQAYAQHYGS